RAPPRRAARGRCPAAGWAHYLPNPTAAPQLYRLLGGIANGPREGRQPPVADHPGPHGPRSPEAPPLDRAEALRRVGGDEGLLAEVAGLFLGELGGWARGLRAA